MSFLYPRKINITRPLADAGVGAVAYNGLSARREKLVMQNVPCSIQFDGRSSKPVGELPGDTIAKSMFKVFIPKSAANLGDIQNRDILTDDQDDRYQVSSNYWDSLGFALRAELLEV